jgi:hypothetical protein
VSPRAKKRIIFFFSTSAFALAAGWLAMHPRHHDPYLFLQGHGLVDVGVIGPGSFGPKEIRLYSWRQPYGEVIAQAKIELAKHGLKLHRDDRNDGSAEWTGEIIDGGLCGESSDLWITISPGHEASLTATRNPNDYIPDWTTVTVSSSLDESWLNVVRYTFFGMRD